MNSSSVQQRYDFILNMCRFQKRIFDSSRNVVVGFISPGDKQ